MLRATFPPRGTIRRLPLAQTPPRSARGDADLTCARGVATCLGSRLRSATATCTSGASPHTPTALGPPSSFATSSWTSASAPVRFRFLVRDCPGAVHCLVRRGIHRSGTGVAATRSRSCVAAGPCRSHTQADFWNPWGVAAYARAECPAAAGAALRSGSRTGASWGGLVSRGGGRVLVYAAPAGVACSPPRSTAVGGADGSRAPQRSSQRTSWRCTASAPYNSASPSMLSSSRSGSSGQSAG